MALGRYSVAFITSAAAFPKPAAAFASILITTQTSREASVFSAPASTLQQSEQQGGHRELKRMHPVSTSTEEGVTSDGGAATWDAAAGVWVGGKLPGMDEEVPSPLWIFG